MFPNRLLNRLLSGKSKLQEHFWQPNRERTSVFLLCDSCSGSDSGHWVGFVHQLGSLMKTICCEERSHWISQFWKFQNTQVWVARRQDCSEKGVTAKCSSQCCSHLFAGPWESRLQILVFSFSVEPPRTRSRREQRWWLVITLVNPPLSNQTRPTLHSRLISPDV